MSALEKETEWISNFVQGDIWKRKRSRFSAGAIVFHIHVYYDELEANNSLGPHPEPLGCSYVSLPCLPPEWSSRLENIFLATIFDADNRSLYGNKCFGELINELIFLEITGVVINHPVHGEVRIFFVVGLVLGDNKGLNGICGFVEGFTANFYCRICCVTRDTAKFMYVEDPTLLRTPESYQADVIANNPSMTGVKELNLFDEIPSFESPTDISVDEFHDVTEGTAHYSMVPILKHFHALNVMFIPTLNNRLYSVDLGVDNDNRPPLINLDRLLNNNKFKMTGAEMNTFVRVFGVLVYDMVPEGDLYYQLYLLLHDILSIVLAKGLPQGADIILSRKIKEHNKLYVQLTKEPLKPKHHLTEHYARLLKLMGPLSQAGTIRYEAKHRHARLTANSCFSRVNLPCTVAIKQQLSFCFRLVCNASVRQPMSYGPSHFLNLRDLDTYPSFSLTLPESIFCEPMQTAVNWVTFKGTTYTPKQIVVTDVDDMGLFQFAAIELVILNRDKPLFLCSTMETLAYFSEVRGYEVKHITDVINWFAVQQESLLDHNPLTTITMFSGQKVIVLKYML